MRVILIIIALIAVLVSPCANAHEIKPGYLEVTENPQQLTIGPAQANHAYSVVWKSPLQLDRPIEITPEFSQDCRAESQAQLENTGASLITRFNLICPTALQGTSVSLRGLEATLTDVLVRFQSISGEQQTLRATPEKPFVNLSTTPSRWDVARTYFVLGTEHIWFGFDHLLFVLGLVLLIQGKRRIIETITAFTIAHSVTLIATALGWVSIAIAPVEAVIALSIVFLATEIACKSPNEKRFTEQNPWIIASAFGLLHGFGFASALSNIGMPHQDVPTALLTFNLGVEFGQLVFVAFILTIIFMIEKARLRRPVEIATSYFIGSLSMFWLFQRLL